MQKKLMHGPKPEHLQLSGLGFKVQRTPSAESLDGLFVWGLLIVQSVEFADEALHLCRGFMGLGF